MPRATSASRAGENPRASADLILSAARSLEGAAAAPTAAARYAEAYLAALRAAAAVLAARARPVADGRVRRPQNVWTLLAGVAPELGEWSQFFTLVAGKRAAAEAGMVETVTIREADDMIREAASFLDLAIAAVGAPVGAR